MLFPGLRFAKFVEGAAMATTVVFPFIYVLERIAPVITGIESINVHPVPALTPGFSIAVLIYGVLAPSLSLSAPHGYHL